MIAMHSPGRRLAHSIALLFVAILAVTSTGWVPAEGAPAPHQQRAVLHAAYPCNTGTTSGMTFTYDDVHRWNEHIIAISNLTGVPANVIKGIMWVESRGMLNARSPLTSSGYYFGLMQIGATSAVPESMKSVSWMCNNAYNQILAGATELVNKSAAIKSDDWTKVAGAYFGYGTDVNGTTTNAYMQMFYNHASAMSGTTPGAADWTPPAPSIPTPIPYTNYATGATLTINTARLNMRTGASTSASIIQVLTRGTQVTVIGGPKKVGSTYWYQIRLADGTTGWISGNYTTGPTPTPTATATTTGTATVTETPTITATPTVTTTPTLTPTAGTTTPSATVTPSPTATPSVAFRTTVNVNLRQSPTTSSASLAVLPKGTLVTALGETQMGSGHTWQKVQAGTRTGWIAAGYITLVITPAPTATRVPSSTPAAPNLPGFEVGDTVEVRVGTLNLRETAGTSSTILGTLKAGTRGVVLDGPVIASGDNWYQIRIDGRPDGWVAGRYVDFVSAAAEPTVSATPSATEAVQTSTATAPAPTAMPTLPPPTETETPVVVDSPTSEPPTETPVIEPSPTTPLDADGDGIEDALDACPGAVDTGLDSDADGIDDGCDASPLGEVQEMTGEPTQTESA